VDVLTSALPDGALRLGATVAGVGLRKGDVELTDGTGFSADLVVAADGVRSPTRALALPGHARLRTMPAVAWRFLAPRPAGLVPARRGERRAGRRRPARRRRVYTYAARRGPADARGAALPRFEGWHDPIPQLFATAQDVLAGRLQELERPLP
jgi:2-polyprenyl-6-methoxyphenol hydroxylase-like FAD-dependent oxidoreductase